MIEESSQSSRGKAKVAELRARLAKNKADKEGRIAQQDSFIRLKSDSDWIEDIADFNYGKDVKNDSMVLIFNVTEDSEPDTNHFEAMPVLLERSNSSLVPPDVLASTGDTIILDGAYGLTVPLTDSAMMQLAKEMVPADLDVSCANKGLENELKIEDEDNTERDTSSDAVNFSEIRSPEQWLLPIEEELNTGESKDQPSNGFHSAAASTGPSVCVSSLIYTLLSKRNISRSMILPIPSAMDHRSRVSQSSNDISVITNGHSLAKDQARSVSPKVSYHAQQAIPISYKQSVVATKRKKAIPEPTFTPKISPFARKLDGTKSVLERQASWLQQRDEKIQARKQQKELNHIAECTFSPLSSGKRRQGIASAFDTGASIAERNRQWSLQKENRLRSERALRIKEELQECTFEPLVPWRSSRADSRQHYASEPSLTWAPPQYSKNENVDEFATYAPVDYTLASTIMEERFFISSPRDYLYNEDISICSRPESPPPPPPPPLHPSLFDLAREF